MIVTSLVNDIVMPLIRLLLQGIEFEDLFITRDGQTYTALAAALAGAPMNTQRQF